QRMDDYDDNTKVEDEVEDEVNINRTNNEEIVKLVDDSVFCIRIDMHPIDQNIIVSGGGDEKSFVQSVLFSKDGQYVASGSMDDPKTATTTLKISSMQSRNYSNIQGITSLVINKESALVLTGSTDGSAILVNLSNGAILGSFENHTSVEMVRFCNILPLSAT
ncbi:45159_t:CDS:2, partial [Gigaspora margarita]